MRQEILGQKYCHHKEWISIKSLDKIQERKKKKTVINNSRTRKGNIKAQAEYIESKKQMKRSIRADKQLYVEELATTDDKAETEENIEQVHDNEKTDGEIWQTRETTQR
ncbi:unnamed protein product [Schistosoma curassoni]|uniref:Uncharacterized protein n=1 Tax=Schistosoma curassoni TaxID=6186 RepID=A0A183JX30_9TREM|nr:unnamed protein product [Schistosoma curassoni]